MKSGVLAVMRVPNREVVLLKKLVAGLSELLTVALFSFNVSPVNPRSPS